MFKLSTVKYGIGRTLSYYKNVIKTKRPAVQHVGEPLITCKRPEFNLYRGDKIDEKATFGSVPLTSDGWHHWKSKGGSVVCFPFPGFFSASVT